jgi:hypothetical protein
MNFNWLKNIFDKAFRLVSDILKEVFDIAFKILMAKLQDIATESITKLATTDLSSAEKRNQAFADIKTYAIQKMISVNDSDINLIIEVIVKNLKKTGIIK